jgi:hypothetical protein
LDGGIRRGTDILKALALGACAVLVGRPVLWGLAVDGARGVQQVLEILHSELERAMKLAGCPTLASIHRSLVKLPKFPAGGVRCWPLPLPPACVKTAPSSFFQEVTTIGPRVKGGQRSFLPRRAPHPRAYTSDIRQLSLNKV